MQYGDRMPLNINIRSLRKAKRLTIAELAAMIGVSTPHLSEVERGKKNLNNHLLLRISSALGVSPDTLIGGDRPADIELISSIVSQLDSDDRARVAAFAEALLQSEQARSHS
jgi:transcriptional regulator with XRE-family HTH domain